MQNSTKRQKNQFLWCRSASCTEKKEESLTRLSPHRSLSSATERCNSRHIGCTCTVYTYPMNTYKNYTYLRMCMYVCTYNL